MASDDLIAKLKAALGDQGVLTGKDAEEKAQGGWSKLGVPAAVLRPASTEEVSKALKLCHAAGEGVVPWGGKTGLVEGGEA
ncbi:MAG: FAD-binding oxidoreductase, partial [Parvibaculum sp.]|nr:FAD-binding oxidoreductase [Parvibaculum sp.]